MNDTACRSCGEPIRWVETRQGKRMPLDVEESSDGNVVIEADGKAAYLTKGARVKGLLLRLRERRDTWQLPAADSVLLPTIAVEPPVAHLPTAHTVLSPPRNDAPASTAVNRRFGFHNPGSHVKGLVQKGDALTQPIPGQAHTQSPKDAVLRTYKPFGALKKWRWNCSRCPGWRAGYSTRADAIATYEMHRKAEHP